MKKFKIFLMISCIFLCFANVYGYIEPDFKLESEATVVYNIDTDQYVVDINGDEILYPASITKVMTALVILNNTVDYDQKIEITNEMLDGLVVANASVMGLRVGEVISIKDLLYGLLLPSGADAANALAYFNSNQIDAFVNEMNRTADKLGCTNTQFMNPTGLDDPKNYTTANDLVLIMKEALKYDLFKEIISTDTYTTSPTNKHPSGITVKTTNSIKNSNNIYYSPFVIGGKTGYTVLAQRTFISYGMTNNGLSYIVVSLKSPFEGYYSVSKCFKDQQLIYEWLNEHFRILTLKQEDDYFDTFKIVHSFKRSFDVHLMEDLNVLVDDSMSASDFTYTTSVLAQYEATIVKDQFVGYIHAVDAQGKMVATAMLKTSDTVKRNTVVILIEQLINAIVTYIVPLTIIAVVLLIVFFIMNLKKRERTRKNYQVKYTKQRLEELQSKGKHKQ